jgi:hypothetical protein
MAPKQRNPLALKTPVVSTGFVLPMAVLLVVVLTISGAGFLQHDYLERRTTTVELDYQHAFFLAQAGLERAREVFKVGVSGDSKPDWTTILDGNDGVLDSEYPTDPAPDLRLCPDPGAYGCVIPPFQVPSGTAVMNDSPIPGLFSAIRGDIFYDVRAFDNDDDEDGETDTDGIIVLRALGSVRGQERLLEVEIKGASGVKLINCREDPGDQTCPELTSGNPTIDAAEDRQPSLTPGLPVPNPLLTDPANPYRDPISFSATGMNGCAYAGSIQSDCHYLITGDIEIKNVTASNVVVFSTGTVTLETGIDLTKTIIIGISGVVLKGNGTLQARLPYPAIMSDGNIVTASGSKTVVGAIYTPATINVNPVDVHGVLYGGQVEVQGSSTYTDDHNSDPTYQKYYAFMPYFTYPNHLKVALKQLGTWKQIE